MKFRHYFLLTTILVCFLFCTTSCTKETPSEVTPAPSATTQAALDTHTLQPTETTSPIPSKPSPSQKRESPPKTLQPTSTPAATLPATAEEFLECSYGKTFKESADAVLKAYFNTDITYFEKNSISMDEIDIYPDGPKDGYSTINVIEFRILEYDRESKTVGAEYIIQGENGCSYLDFTLKFTNDKWVILYCGLDA